MIDSKNTLKLYIITLIIDIFILYSIIYYNLNLFDQIWSITILLSHLMFFYALSTYYKTMLDFLHILVFALPFLAIFTSNIITKIVSCLLLFVIQILWIKEKCCILNEKNDSFGYGDYLNYYTLTLTIFLALQIGYKLKQTIDTKYISCNNEK